MIKTESIFKTTGVEKEIFMNAVSLLNLESVENGENDLPSAAANLTTTKPSRRRVRALR